MNLTIKEALQLYDQLKDQQSIHGTRKHFKLPECDYSVRLAHKIWAKLQGINNHENKHPGLQKLEIDNLNKLLAAIAATPLDEIHRQLTALDKVADNTH